MTKTPKQAGKSPVPSEEAFDSKGLPDKIGTSLRSLYDSVLSEEVPDDFLNLLQKADEAQAGKEASSGSGSGSSSTSGAAK